MEGLGGSQGGVMGSVFGSGGPKVQAAAPKKVNISAGVAVGMLIQKTTARLSAHCQGGARFRARWCCRPPFPRQERSKIYGRQRAGHVAAGGHGCSEDLALQAYLLNNEPVEVETTVNVIFTLGG